MAIKKKLIHFNKKQNFENEVANGNILDTSIVFIQDSKEINTHGTVYKTVNWSILQPIPVELIYFTVGPISELTVIKEEKTYAVQKGMSFRQFCESEYNIDNWQIVLHYDDSYRVLTHHGEYLATEFLGYHFIQPDDIIDETIYYTWGLN